MSKELIYETECGPDDVLYKFVYDFEPYSKGGWEEPPSGGNAIVTEIRLEDGSVLPEAAWKAAGIDVEKIQEDIYEWHCDNERGRRESYEEDRADDRRRGLD